MHNLIAPHKLLDLTVATLRLVIAILEWWRSDR
jgi:hypothetical protein